MKKYFLISAWQLTVLVAIAQPDSLSKTRFVIGLSAPELLHTGLSIDLGKTNQLGISAGIGPSWGTVWPTLNLEHRLYVGKLDEKIKRRHLFLKQGATYFTAAKKQTAVTFTVGADLKSKTSNRGWTIDAGIFYLMQNEKDRKNILFPALRFQHYQYLKKRSV